MLFFEFRFLVFFAFVFCLVWSLRSNWLRKFTLLVASYCFYAAWDWRFLSLILASTLIDFFVARRLVAQQGRARRAWLMVSLSGNLGILGFFKYFDFFADNATRLLNAAGMASDPITLKLILPMGISFYTFQAMSYTIDVYRRELEPRKNFIDVALFITFFGVVFAPPVFGTLAALTGSYGVGFIVLSALTGICGVVLFVRRGR